MNCIATVTSVLVCVILIGALLVPVVEDFAEEEVTNTGAAEGLSLGYFLSSDDWPSAAISITADTSGVTLSGDYAGTVSASDCILAVSDTAAAYLKGGKLIWYDGSTRSQTDSLTLTLDGSAHTLNGVAAQWVYLPQTGGAYGSYSGSIANQLSDVVAVGDFAGVVMISDGTEILSGNSYGLAATVGTGDGGEITGVTYDSAMSGGSSDDGAPSTIDVSTAEAPTGSTLVGDLYYAVSENDAAVVGVSDAIASGSLTTVVIPGTVDIDGSTRAVTRIGDSAFRDCTGLTSIELPASITSIGDHVFRDCTGLTSISLPASITSIGDNVFNGCTGLTSIELPAGIPRIGYRMFYLCAGLTSIELPAGITSIGDSAFNGCTGLTSIELPAGISHLGVLTFNNCTGLTSIELPADLTSIGTSTFNNCTGLTSIELPADLTSIGKTAFSGCTSLTSIALPAGITSIAEKTFKDCTGLTEILNLSSVELTSSMGITDAMTVSDSIHSLSVIQKKTAVQQKAGAEYTIVSMLPILAIIALLLFAAGAVYRRF